MSPDDPRSSPSASADRSTFERVGQWVLLVAGVLILIYAFWPPVKPPFITLSGSLLGFEPVRRAAQ